MPTPDTPTLGILGGGQLGRMLALAAAPLGVRTIAYDPSPDACAGHVTQLVTADWDDEPALSAFAGRCDAVTYEFENVPIEAARLCARRAPLRPGLPSLDAARDRLRERELFAGLSIPTPDSANIETDDDLRRSAGLGLFPAIMKARRLGYDGKGQTVVRTADDLEAAWATLGRVPALLDRMIPFERELSAIVVRGLDGTAAAWPLAQNVHTDGILRTSTAPARVTPETERAATTAAAAIAERLGHVGVLAVEFFELPADATTGDTPRLLANEIAPRVHNTGHWTMDAAQTCQFENHVRAVLGMPLGPTAPRPGVTPDAPAVMTNLIGDLPGTQELLSSDPAARIHRYGKAPRPGRKVGHVTTLRMYPAPNSRGSQPNLNR